MVTWAISKGGVIPQDDTSISERIEFRREIRVNPLRRRHATLSLPDYEGDLYESHFSDKGVPLGEFSTDGLVVRVLTPYQPWYFIEGKPTGVGEGSVYDRHYAIGADRVFLVNKFSLPSLELLVDSISKSVTELGPMADGKEGTRLFYPYIIYDIASQRIAGRLLASREVGPTIKEEIMTSMTYHREKERCLYCDIGREEYEKFRRDPDNSRMIVGAEKHRDNSIGFLNFSASDPFETLVLPFGHVTDINRLSKAQKISLANTIYHALLKLVKTGQRIERNFDFVYASFHSAPLYRQNDLDSLMGNSANTYKVAKIQDAYHFHVEMGVGKGKGPYEPQPIPGLGFNVVSGRLANWAKLIRSVDTLISHHQP